MRRTTPTSFRLHPETLATLRRLARPGEALAGVLVRAIECLDQSQGVGLPPALEARLQALEARLRAVERQGSDRVATKTPPPRLASSDRVATPPPPDGATTPQGRRYPPEVRREAALMARRGATPGEVRQWLQAQLGYAPQSGDMSKMLKVWSRGLDASTD